MIDIQLPKIVFTVSKFILTVDEDNDKTRTVYFLNYYLSASVANRNIHTYFANNSNRPINTTNSLKKLNTIDIYSIIYNRTRGACGVKFGINNTWLQPKHFFGY